MQIGLTASSHMWIESPRSLNNGHGRRLNGTATLYSVQTAFLEAERRRVKRALNLLFGYEGVG